MNRICCASFIAVCALFASHCGCGSNPPPAPRPSPPFVLPARGSATDTALRIGDAFPELAGTDLDGNPLTIGKEHYGERATLVVFWSTWCGFCLQELPHEIELSNLYADRGLRVIGVNADDTADEARAVIDEHAIPWITLREGPQKTVSNALQIAQWPTLYLLDAEGRVVAATPFLRSIGAEVLADGTAQQVNALDWTLEQVLESRDH